MVDMKCEGCVSAVKNNLLKLKGMCSFAVVISVNGLVIVVFLADIIFIMRLEVYQLLTMFVPQV